MAFTERWHNFRTARNQYCSKGRDPFFFLAGQYLPSDPEAVVVDVGPGNGRFADLLRLQERFANVHLLDGNPATVADLADRYPGAALYRCPERLPFADGTVHFLHCSHLVEHLQHQDLLRFLRECDRVLAVGAVMVVSTPLLWERFYEDLSHVKPYGPGIFLSYLCLGGDQRSAATVSRQYAIERLVYRLAFRCYLADSGLGNRYAPLDLLVQAGKKVANLLGFGRYERTGYTIVLRKGRAREAAPESAAARAAADDVTVAVPAEAEARA